jgi:hypothetical protein
MVPRDLHLGDEEFDQLKVGERIRVEIQKSRFQLRDPFIVSVGVYRGRAGAPTRVMPQIATTTQAQPQVSVAPTAAQAQVAIPEEADEAEEEGAEEEGGEEKEEE